MDVHFQPPGGQNVYSGIDDQIGSKGISYDLSNTVASSPVSVDGRRLRLDLPQSFEKALSITVEFEGSKLTATGKNLFADYWERVP